MFPLPANAEITHLHHIIRAIPSLMQNSRLSLHRRIRAAVLIPSRKCPLMTTCLSDLIYISVFSIMFERSYKNG